MQHKKYFLTPLILVAFFPILKMAPVSLSIVLSVLISLLYFILNKSKLSKEEKRRNVKWFFISTGFYFWLLFSLFYSSSKEKGIEELQHSLSLLLFPLIVFVFIDFIPKKIINNINICFVAANVFLAIFLSYTFYVEGVFNSTSETTFYNLPFREALTKVKFNDYHPTYISLWFSYSFLFLLNLQINKGRNLSRYTNLLIVIIKLFFLGFIIVLSSRIVQLSFIVALIIFLLLEINKIKTKIIFISSILLITILLVTKVSFFKSRFIDEYKATELSAPIGDKHNSINIRVGTYICSIEVINSNLLFGVGVGSVQKALNSCYNNFNTDVYKNTTYNSHNYYFHMVMASGIIGVVLLLILLYKTLKTGIKAKNSLYVSFVVLIIISLLSENIFVRIHGVLFFAFFNSLFIKEIIQNSTKSIDNSNNSFIQR